VRSGNALFIALPATSLTASVAILALGKRYEGQFCSAHAHYKDSG
jgi:hypothetical protein